MAILGRILTQAIRRPKTLAVIDDHRRMTYAELVGGAFFLAEQIEQATSNRHIGLLLPTSGAGAMAIVAGWIAGRTVVPLNYLLSHDELKYVIEDSEVDTIITVGPLLDFLKLRPVIPTHINLMLLESLDFQGIPPFRWPARAKDDEVAAILYTSGTSGRPKGVMLTHDNLSSNALAGVEHAKIDRVDTFLGVLPQFHSFGLTGLTALPLSIGATVVYSARFVPKQIIQLMRKHRPHIFMAVPSMYAALLSVKDATADDFKSLRFAVSGAEPLPHSIFETYRERFNVTLLEGYGLTETSPLTSWATPWEFKEHSVGKTVPKVEVAIAGENDQLLGPNEEGEILITGPNIMKGYFKLPEQTAEVFVDLPSPNGGGTRRYFRSGDIGHIDDDGLLYITGRKKEMLIIGGENVFPREIEEVLCQHEQIKAAAVIGVPDDLRGEVPIAFVELEDDVAPDDFDAKAARNWSRETLAQFKVPREIRVIDELPRNPTGKILRRKLVV